MLFTIRYRKPKPADTRRRTAITEASSEREAREVFMSHPYVKQNHIEIVKVIPAPEKSPSTLFLT